MNAKRNIAFGFINKSVNLLFPFVLRIVLIRKLGVEYLGLGSLFESILQVLNITELGFSNAVVFSMYKPVAEDDTETLCAILNFYKRIYFIIGIVIAFLGLSILPFLPKFIKGTYPNNINIYFLYLIYLVSTVVSYLLFAYKNALINAYQRSDITSKINTASRIFLYGMQIMIIIFTKNYYLFAMMFIIASVVQNICIESISCRLFPSIICKGFLSYENKNIIKTKVKGLFINKLCLVSRNSFDSIFISAFLGLTQTAIYNNYYYIMCAVHAVLGIISTSILAGVGNSVVTENQYKNYRDFKKINFIFMWLSGWCGICLLCLYQPFIELAFGKDMVFSFDCVILFCIYFYVLQMGVVRTVYSDACGLWWENRFRAIIETVTNLILNYVLGKYFGIYGIISATLISLFLINFIWGSSIIYKHYFTEIKMFEYYRLHLLYCVVTIITGLITFSVCNCFFLKCDENFVFRFLICLILPNVIFITFYARTSLFSMVKNWHLIRFYKK